MQANGRRSTANSGGGAPRRRKAAGLPSTPQLVGSVLEKGFSSSPTLPPQPTGLPFPVARHRSDGPHWKPLSVSELQGGDEDDDMNVDLDHKDFTDLTALASAEPLRRKERKQMDFSHWREILSRDSAPAPPRRSTRKGVINDGRKAVASASPADALSDASLAYEKQTDCRDRNPDIHPEMKHAQTETRVAASVRDQPTGEIGGMVSLEDEIDAENVGRIANMSADEIAEARAEIMAKMDASVVEMLKKRAWAKAEGKKSVNTENEDKGRMSSKVGTTPVVSNTTDTVTAGGVSSSVVDATSWKVWRDRVEKVRLIRFSLDGDLLAIDPPSMQHDGKQMHDGWYSAGRATERDILRTEGDPASIGYTINEAVVLTRSMVAGQRVLALQIIGSILGKALQNMQKASIEGSQNKVDLVDNIDDWQAIWAYALGPEPQLALSLRMALDDNHDSVVMSCAKVIQLVLSFDINENFFDMSERAAVCAGDSCTAPVFRSKSELSNGFLNGCFWKYNTKPSNLLPFNGETANEEDDAKHNIQDDLVVAGQDIGAGLIRMGVLPRICYLLEMDPLQNLEDCLVSILIALGRHSPQSADAILRLPRLIQAVVKVVNKQNYVEVLSSQIKGITLLKVLSKYNRDTCLEFVNNGTFQRAMWQWYRDSFTLEDWKKSGREQCKLKSTLMVEQLRFWRVCISFGYCMTYFMDFFPMLCNWLSPPDLDNLVENHILYDFCSVTREAYLVLGALAQRLPPIHSVQKRENGTFDDHTEPWSWSHALPMVEYATQWLSMKNVPSFHAILGLDQDGKYNNEFLGSVLWVMSAVLCMVTEIVKRIAPSNDSESDQPSSLPWLPEFVPRISLEIIRNQFFSFSSGSYTDEQDFPVNYTSLFKRLCHLRSRNSDDDASMSAVSCLRGLVQAAVSIDRVVGRSKAAHISEPIKQNKSGLAGKILEHGIMRLAEKDIVEGMNVLMAAGSSKRYMSQSLEMFARGGPSPGIGFGWGTEGGGYWSLKYQLAQLDCGLFVDLMMISLPSNVISMNFDNKKDILIEESNWPGTTPDATAALQRINFALGVCLSSSPIYRVLLERVFDILFNVPALKFLVSCICQSAHHAKLLEPFELNITMEEYVDFSEKLKSHFRTRWLCTKKKLPKSTVKGSADFKDVKKAGALDTIHEEEEQQQETVDSPCSVQIVEWAHQRLPLPDHWYLSAICCIGDPQISAKLWGENALDVARAGLLFVLGLESSVIPSLADDVVPESPIPRVPLVWKMHSLSMSLHANMDLLQDNRSRRIFKALQDMYGLYIDKSRSVPEMAELPNHSSITPTVESSSNHAALAFGRTIHESYSNFIGNLVEQFAAMSYGDEVFGRQIAVYLHLCVEPAIRLSAWNSLASASALELLPPLDKCIGKAEGYLEPHEENDGLLEAYTKSLTSGSLDKAAKRQSLSFSLAVHHLSCFIFQHDAVEKQVLRNKLAKALMRCSLQKHETKGFMRSLILHKVCEDAKRNTEVQRRMEILKDASEGNSSLAAAVEKLRKLVEMR